MPSSRDSLLLLLSAAVLSACGGGKDSVATSASDGPSAPQMWVATDAACPLDIDGAVVAQLEADELTRLPIAPGLHRLSCYPHGETLGAQQDAFVSRNFPAIVVIELRATDDGKSVGAGLAARAVAERQAAIDRRAAEAGLWTDLDSGLSWIPVALAGESSWAEAVAACSVLRVEQATNWRLPTAEETQNLLGPRARSFRIPVDLSRRFWLATRIRPGDTALYFFPELAQRGFQNQPIGERGPSALCVRSVDGSVPPESMVDPGFPWS